jgi:hypothetical protein
MPANTEWSSIALLGALHGVNPAMGWLFAVSLGLQARSSRAVWAALGPLALGHALAVAAALAGAAVLGIALPPAMMKWLAAAALLGFGMRHLRSHSHPRWGVAGMCVGTRELTTWSFLVSSAHGAGLMVLPFVLGGSARDTHTHTMHAAMTATAGEMGAGVATLVHTAGYLAMSGVIAWIVYAKVGLRLLRNAWLNVNAIWALALIVTAVVTPFL